MNSAVSHHASSMPATELKTLHLDDFCGQKLVVIFCPSDPRDASAEIDAYQAHAEAFEQSGTWLVAVPPSGMVAPADGKSHLKLAADPNGLAFQMLAARFPGMLETTEDVVFLVDRDGVARHAWKGCGHADDVLKGVRERP